MTRLKLVVLHSAGRANATLSYQSGWPRALRHDPRFSVETVDLARLFDRLALRGVPRMLDRADAIVLLHSVFSNECALPPSLERRVAAARPPKVLFVGNEYKLMPQKVELARALDVSLLVSQLSSPAAHDLYRDALDCAVVAIPNTGFDPERFRPTWPRRERPIVIGYRSFRSPIYLGHDERGELAERVGAAAARRGLATDISLDPADRFDEPGWADFLNRCRAQIGSEAGADYFELTDETRLAVHRFLDERPDASLAEVRREIFDGRERVSGRALSGRIVEAAATKTVQILLEGEYGGFFQPDVHYLGLRHDFSNLDEVLDRLADDDECDRLAEAAYEVARAELTYESLVGRLHEALLPLVASRGVL